MKNSMFFPIHCVISPQMPFKEDEHLSNRILSIPCFYSYSQDDIEYICKTIIEIDQRINTL